MKYSTDFKSWLVVFSISFTLSAEVWLKFFRICCSFAVVYSKDTPGMGVMMLFWRIWSSHCDSTRTLYFMRAASEKYGLREAALL
jgi:hypothetical protein